MKQFGRVLQLKIGNKEESVLIKNLRVAFEITKTITKEPNPAKIVIYNLNESHRNLITQKIYNFAELFIGYATGDLRLVFCGDIQEVTTSINNCDIITNLKCGDGYTAYSEKTIVKTFNAGQKDSDFWNEALISFELESGAVEMPNDRSLPRAKVFMCDTKDALDKIASNNNADWSIQDNQLILIPKTSALKNDEGFIISRETGMVGSPQKSNKGLEVKCLCNPHLKIGGLVRVESKIKEYNGDYKITSLTHSGDLMGGDWVSRIVCINGQFKEM